MKGKFRDQHHRLLHAFAGSFRYGVGDHAVPFTLLLVMPLYRVARGIQRDDQPRRGDDIHTPISASLCSKRGDSSMVVLYISCRNQSASSGTYKLWASNLSIPKK